MGIEYPTIWAAPWYGRERWCVCSMLHVLHYMCTLAIH